MEIMENGKQECLEKRRIKKGYSLMKNYITIVVLLFSITVSSAQERQVKPLNRINLGVFPTGINYSREIPIAKRSTVEGSAGISLTYYIDNFGVQLGTDLSVDYKFYYNIGSRERKGKNTAGNSGSFVGATAYSNLFPLNKLEQSNNKSFQFGGAIFWGIRQQIKDSGFQVNFLGGPALAMEGLTDNNPSLFIRTGISYIF